ncbi:sensor histidine kinase [Nonomuraea turcica]|uniref:sensor histidine kinase n=1 Tax=Nonomuraea sp. G32 TaxID=3067274 RepID=UPI00273C15A8|nr:sensor histidine kinase [Nonomuraea sp. G32]MDP4511172.1 sensor histidine kinase [Nonomuraea sp. G32]
MRWWMVVATIACAGAWTALAWAAAEGWAFAVYLLGLVPLGLGWLIALRAPASPVPGALAGVAVSMLAVPALEEWGRHSWWGAVIWSWQVVGFLLLLLVFPDGLLPGRRWRVAAAAMPLSAAGVTAAMVVTMNHYDPPPVARSPLAVPEGIWMPLMVAALAVLLVVSVASVSSVVVRYRRGDERVRAQTRWLVLAAVLVVVLMVASWAITALGWAGPAAYGGFLIGIVVLVPAAVAVAVLRHDLFEIDRILGDSAAWVLTAIIAAGVFAASAVVLGSFFGRDSPLGGYGAVFVAALILMPVFRRVHDATGRVFDRDRTVILAGIADFVDRVRDGTAEPESVQEALRALAGDPGLVLLLTEAERGGYVDIWGADAEVPADRTTLPLRTADAEIGVVVLGRASARQLRRVRLAVSAAGLPIEVSRLRLGLRRVLAEVSESRRRLVSAAVAERKRLERDLHDGAQQHLLAVGMQLRAAQRRLDPADPLSLELDLAVDRLEDTVGELRRLAHGLRPASLDDGLTAALRRLAAQCALPVDLRAGTVVTSDVVTATAYFLVAEAMTNVLKHAEATGIRVSVRQAGDCLHIAVTDDGVGFTPSPASLTTLRDRVSAIGGTLSVISAPHEGTTIEAEMPCAS